MTLWHEGFPGIGNNLPALKSYMQTYIKFVKERMFDRTFLQSQDPDITDNYGKKKFLFADPEFIVDYYLSKLPDYTTAGLLGIIDPRYIWYYSPKTSGGIWGNNPGYKDAPSSPYYCQTPYRECSGDNDQKCASNTNPGNCDPTNCKNIDKSKPYCLDGKCSKYPACSEITDYCKGSKCCVEYPLGCPNNLEQFFKYVGDINNIAKQKGVKKRITTIAFDGEDFGAYGEDPYGLVQAWQAARKYAPDVNEIGYARGPSQVPSINWTNAAYPELYWIGELKPAVGCNGCKSGESKNTPGCLACKKSIYQTHKNDPQGMLDAFSKWLGNPGTKYKEPGTCPLFSIEMAHFNGKGCIQNIYYPDADFCGTFDGFADWDWDKFEEFLTLFSHKYDVKDIGVYEFQFVPPSWVPKGIVYPPTLASGAETHVKKYWWVYLLVILIIVLTVIFFFKRKHT
jgi:hypothetical protein